MVVSAKTMLNILMAWLYKSSIYNFLVVNHVFIYYALLLNVFLGLYVTIHQINIHHFIFFILYFFNCCGFVVLVSSPYNLFFC